MILALDAPDFLKNRISFHYQTLPSIQAACKRLEDLDIIS
jgi:hypothetical protein